MQEPRNRIYFYLPVIITVCLSLGILAGQFLPSKNTKVVNSGRSFGKLNAVLSYIKDEYVDEIPDDTLIEKSIPSILQNLDPHSVYIPAVEFSEVNEPLEGNFDGIGVQFNIQNDTIMVVNTIPGGPSEKYGIMAGDRIVFINDTLVAGKKITNEQVMKKLKGKRNTHVKVTIQRRSFKNLLPFDIIRNQIPIVSIDASFMAATGIGYVKINKFARTTAADFHMAVRSLQRQGMNKIIVDLRGNGGGYLDAATNIADEFLRKGQLIVYTKGRRRTQENTYATARGLLLSEPVVILIDEWSASASEILAGAIQDNDRGTIMGRRSFGKGLVQEQVPFPDGSSMRLTVARYYTPTGRCIQKPYDKGGENYYGEIMNRYHNGELEDKDSIKQNRKLKYTTPRGKTVYGGGGITPDIFVPFDTTDFTRFYTFIYNGSYMYRFAFEYTDAHRAEYKRYSSWQELENHLDKQPLYATFIDYCKAKGLKPDAAEVTKSEHLISLQLKAYIIRNIYDDKGFYPVYMKTDAMYKKALEFLSSH